MPTKKTKIITARKDSEKWLESRLVDLVADAGGKALKFASDTETGYPDRLVLMPGGKAYWVELKSKGKKPRLLQKIRHSLLTALGFPVYVIDREELLDNFINDIKNVCI